MQLGSAPSLVVDKVALTEASGVGGDELITVVSTVGWRLEIPLDASWITSDKSAGAPGSTKVKVSYLQNAVGKPKQAFFTIIPSGTGLLPVKVKVLQNQPEISINAGECREKGGAELLIQGTGFSNVVSDNEVKINGHAAEVKKASFNFIKLTIHASAGDGSIEVKVGSKIGSVARFRYEWIWNVSFVVREVEDACRLAAFDQTVYVLQPGKNRISKINNEGTFMHFAGSRFGEAGDKTGYGEQALFSRPSDILTNANGDLYVTDRFNNSTKVIDLAGHVALAAAGNISNPTNIAMSGDRLLVASFESKMLAFVTPTYEKLSIEYSSYQMVADNKGNLYYTQGAGIIKYNLAQHTTSVFAGSTTATREVIDGLGPKARFKDVRQMAFDKEGSLLLVEADGEELGVVRIVTPEGRVTTIAGANEKGDVNSEGSIARFYFPNGIAVAPNGRVYVADTWNNKSRVLTRL